MTIACTRSLIIERPAPHLLETSYGAIECVLISPFEIQIGAATGLHLALALPLAGRAHELTVFLTQVGLAITGIGVQGDIYPADAPRLGVTSIVELDALRVSS